MTTDHPVLDWLLDSDPALRWQVERDLTGMSPDVWQATRARVGTEGFGAVLLAEQDADGQWAGGAFFPAGFFGSAESSAPGQPWTATTWALKDLREWGLDAAVLSDTAARLATHGRWEYGDLAYWGGEVDVCINSYTLAAGAWLGAATTRWPRSTTSARSRRWRAPPPTRDLPRLSRWCVLPGSRTAGGCRAHLFRAGPGSTWTRPRAKRRDGWHSSAVGC